MIILGIIVAIFMFSIIILIHEWGHFYTARKFGVKVEEFGLGIPPRAKKLYTDKKGTIYSLNRLPLGGFVRLTGEQINTYHVFDKDGSLYNNEQLEKDIKNGEDIFSADKNKLNKLEKSKILDGLHENKAKYNLINKSPWQQAIIILAGVFMNFIFAIIIFSTLFFIGVKPIGINSKMPTNLNLKLIPTYEQAIENGLLKVNSGVLLFPIKDSIAEKSGIKKGDILTQVIIKDKKIIINSTEELIEIIGKNAGIEIEFIIIRENKIIKTPIIPLSTGENSGVYKGKIGAYVGDNVEINKDFKYKYNLIDSIKYGTIETYNQSILTFKGIGLLLENIFTPETKEQREKAIKEMAGPIGIVDFISNSLSAGFIFILIIGAIISINLGVFNLLPIPALDGGRFIFITINGILVKIFGKKIISERTEGIIHLLFFILLIALSLIIGYNDITKIIER